MTSAAATVLTPEHSMSMTEPVQLGDHESQADILGFTARESKEDRQKMFERLRRCLSFDVFSPVE